MKIITSNIVLLLFCAQIWGQSANFMHLDITEDTATSFFNHVSGYVTFDYSDDTVQFYTTINKLYIEGRIGNGPWVNMDNHIRMASVITTIPPAKRRVYGSLFQLFQGMDTSEIKAYQTSNAPVEFRFYVPGAFMEVYDADAPYHKYYSNIDTVYLPTATNEEMQAFMHLKKHVVMRERFSWLQSFGSINENELIVLEHIVQNYPNSTAADIAEYYLILDFRRKILETPPLTVADKALYLERLKALFTKTKSAWIRQALSPAIYALEN